ncbi:carbon-nitrogen hydrolase family protein [Arthrobacter sp. P2b]|uniref:carbon-nitrogen hydrolase family protein n=1 Tax=Arthrobacter sp. P2b TaxID=1938741 RepID=UPI0009A7DD0C|nr:carbon-nitrogen hydrolase family protein [Arthrobacter sp. P2b]SLJ92934.1 Predicted amidohydrolase [Arthrobacter sp. P2b]
MTETLPVAVVQYEPVRSEGVAGHEHEHVRHTSFRRGSVAGEIQENVAEHVRLIEDADAHGSRLVLFPELSLTGYRLDQLAAPDSWLTTDDSRLSPVREICRRTGITAVVGAPFREADGTKRLASLVLHPDGSTETAFKTHLHGQERDLFVPGNGAGLIEVDGWRIALALCFDAAVPAHAAMAADAGADVYCVSALYTRSEEHRLALHLGARAMDCRMFTLLANLGGSTTVGESCGLSGVWSPHGLPLASASGTRTEVVTCLLQRSVVTRYRTIRGVSTPGNP